MKISKIHTLWIILVSVFYVAYTCSKASIRSLFNAINRTWVTEELQRWLKRTLRLIDVTCTVVNPHNVSPQPGQPTIVMCNHTSLYDIPLSLYAFPKNPLRMLAKAELSKLPIMSRGMRVSEFPFIDRKNKHQAIKDLARVRELLQSGIVMWIAPEGTRSQNGKLGTFKKGGFITAIQAKATIIPIGIRGAYEILPPRTSQFNLGQHAEVHIGEPIDASAYTLETKDALIANVHTSMKKLVGESL